MHVSKLYRRTMRRELCWKLITTLLSAQCGSQLLASLKSSRDDIVQARERRRQCTVVNAGIERGKHVVQALVTFTSSAARAFL